jgi:hypothetical protein
VHSPNPVANPVRFPTRGTVGAEPPGVARHPERPVFPGQYQGQTQSRTDLADLRAQSALLKLQLQQQVLQTADDVVTKIGDLLTQPADAAADAAQPSLADAAQDLLQQPDDDATVTPPPGPDDTADQVNDLLSDKAAPVTPPLADPPSPPAADPPSPPAADPSSPPAAPPTPAVADPASAPAVDPYPGAVDEAQKAVIAGDFLEAFAAARRAVAARPGGYQGHYLAAYAAWKLNQIDKARSEADLALAVAPAGSKNEARILLNAVNAAQAVPR